MPALAPETTTASVPDVTLASTAGVPTEAVTAFRAGVPHWTLERPGVITKLAQAMGVDEGLIRANHTLAKSAALGQRRHAGAGPNNFGGSFPSIR